MKKLFKQMTKQKVGAIVTKVYYDFIPTVASLGVCLLVGRRLLPFEEEHPVLVRTLGIVVILFCWGLEIALRRGIRYLRNWKSKTDEKEI